MKADMEALQKELDNSRIKIMINQMQPHFLYNSLSAIQAIVKTDPDYAYQLLFDFTVHLRSSIKALSSDEPIPFNDELKNIKAYLNIERMRFGDRLNVKYEIDCEDFLIIPLSIQPLAENAAIHGILPKQEQGGTVTIRTYETFKTYIVEVEDDGVGFDAGKVMSEQGDSVGLKNTIFRLKSLMNATVDIDSQIGTGTKVTVSIPKERRSLQ
jgi:LytS/YehU family sensor histidine kinase